MAGARPRIRSLFPRFFNSEKTGGVLLLACTILSLLLANLGPRDAYTGIFHQSIGPAAAGLHLGLEGWINDGLMAVFFLMVGLEVERELYVGELSVFRKAVLPLAAAIGGMLVPSLFHYLLNRGTATQAGFAIPMATDIAFALGILSLAGRRVPTSVKIFLAALAIIDDIGAILVIAFFYTGKLSLPWLGGAIGICCLLAVFNRMRVRYLWCYLLPGALLWYCLLRSGVHATISGVLLAFFIPFDERDEHNMSLRLQRSLHKPVAFGILPLFALANTAIGLPAHLSTSLSGPNALGIMGGLFLGKVTGIFSFPWLLLRLGLARLHGGLSWRGLLGIGFLGGIGFTMSMFIANLAFPDAATVVSSKLSILLASTLSASIGLLLFLTGPRRNTGT